MTLKQARALRDEIRERGWHCIVPLGHGPDKYFARIYSAVGGGKPKEIDLESRQAWLLHFQDSQHRQREAEHKSRPRSPIEMMIDRACGLE